MDIAVSVIAPKKVDVRQFLSRKLIREIVVCRFRDTEKHSERTYKTPTAKNAISGQCNVRRQLGCLHRVLENLGKTLCMWVNNGLFIIIGSATDPARADVGGRRNRPHVAHEAVASDLLPLTT
jgi:hypothetical protein